MMKKKENRLLARQAVQQAVLRDEQNRRIQEAASTPVNVLLNELHAPLSELAPEAVDANRAKYGSNKVTHEKRNLCPGGWQVHLSILLLPFCSVWLWCPP